VNSHRLPHSRGRKEHLSVVAIVLACLVPPVGFVLGIIALCRKPFRSRRGTKARAIIATSLGGVLVTLTLLTGAPTGFFMSRTVCGPIDSNGNQSCQTHYTSWNRPVG
jgi:hypothetical protein